MKRLSRSSFFNSRLDALTELVMGAGALLFVSARAAKVNGGPTPASAGLLVWAKATELNSSLDSLLLLSVRTVEFASSFVVLLLAFSGASQLNSSLGMLLLVWMGAATTAELRAGSLVCAKAAERASCSASLFFCVEIGRGAKCAALGLVCARATEAVHSDPKTTALIEMVLFIFMCGGVLFSKIV